jgi:hypothetical protein
MKVMRIRNSGRKACTASPCIFLTFVTYLRKYVYPLQEESLIVVNRYRYLLCAVKNLVLDPGVAARDGERVAHSASLRFQQRRCRQVQVNNDTLHVYWVSPVPYR